MSRLRYIFYGPIKERRSLSLFAFFLTLFYLTTFNRLQCQTKRTTFYNSVNHMQKRDLQFASETQPNYFVNIIKAYQNINTQ